MKRSPLCFALALGAGILAAQETSITLPEEEAQALQAFEALMKMKVSVASFTPRLLREAPGIVTLLTRREILDSGAKDLQDLLRLVPGFEVVSDTQGNLTLAFRGNWGNNGKVLILVDGFEQNDLFFGSLYLDNSFPLENVRRIEIIRGPGSAIYGGFGEIAVINVLTRNGRELRGAAATIDYGSTQESFAHRNWFAGYGNAAGDLEYSVAWHGRNGNRSDREFTRRPPLDPIDLTNRAKLDDRQANLALSYQGLAIRYLEDHVKLNDPRYPSLARLSGVVVPDPELQFNHKYLDARYTFHLTGTLTLMPKLTWRQSNPWYYHHQEGLRKFIGDRRTLGVQGIWDPKPGLNMVFGYEAYRDDGRFRGSLPPASFGLPGGKTDDSYTNHALYGQVIWHTDLGDLTLGGRYEHHSAAGGAFVPRFGLTKVFGPTYVKILAAGAFRAPALQQFQPTVVQTPERANTYEMELGRQFSDIVLATVNVFNIRIRNPYLFDSSAISPSTTQGGAVQTRGLESTLQVRGEFGYLTGSVSFYEAVSNTVLAYTVPQDAKALVGAPRWKYTLSGKIMVTRRLSFSPSLVATSRAYGPTIAPNPPGPTITERPGSTVIDAFLHYRVPGTKLECSGGCHNLTNTDHDYLGGHLTNVPLLPGPGREFTLRAVYNY